MAFVPRERYDQILAAFNGPACTRDAVIAVTGTAFFQTGYDVQS